MKKAKQSNGRVLHKQFSQAVPAMSAADCRYFIHLLQMRLNQQTEVRQKANSNDVSDEFYQLPLSSFGLSISTAGRLRNNGIITVKDAANLNKQAFLMVRNFGEIMWRQLEEKVFIYLPPRNDKNSLPAMLQRKNAE